VSAVEAASPFSLTRKGLACATPSIIWFGLVQRRFFGGGGRGGDGKEYLVVLREITKI